MFNARGTQDMDLVRRLIAGDGAAWETFVKKVSDPLYALCIEVFGDRGAEAAYLALFKRIRESGGSVLADYNGRAPLRNFIVLKAADLLADQIVGLFGADPEQAWRAFERFFRRDLLRAIHRRLADFSTGYDVPSADDVYQEVCAALVEDDYRRLRAYDGKGSFSGFVRRTARNLTEDVARKALGRRRLPLAVAEMGDIEQQVYRLLFWEHRSPDDLCHEVRTTDGQAVPEARLQAALDAVTPHGGQGERPRMEGLEVRDGAGGFVARPLPDAAPDPEAALIRREDDGVLEEALAGLAGVLATLPEEARLYLQCRFLREPPLKPGEIAPLLGLPVKELYKMRTRWEGALRHGLEAAGIDKFPELSV